MPGESPDQIPTQRNNTTLEYASRAIKQPGSHPPVMLLVLLLTALGGVWSIIGGVTCLGDIWVFGLLLIAAGVCQCWATLGKLSAGNLRPRAALGLLVPAIAMNVIVVVIAHRAYVVQEARYASMLPIDKSRWRQLPTETERQVFTFGLLRDAAAACSALDLLCALYSGRLMSRRKVEGE